MVIITSDSNGTLVSLDNRGLKHIASFESFPSSEKNVSFRRTSLQLPLDEDNYFENDDDCFSLDDSCNDDYFTSMPATYTPESRGQELYLPATSDGCDLAIDECLLYIPCLRDTRDELIAKGSVHFDQSSKEKILYVGQGEVAHCTPSQCDILVSDKATTCHILALRSTSSVNVDPLCSLTHLDGTSYDSCVRGMFKEHLLHHVNSSRVNVDVHVMGGFDNEASRAISTWLLHLLADIADDYQHVFSMTLKTVAISRMNDVHGCGPIGRGLALDCHTGIAGLAKCSSSVAGPEQVLRSTRLWCNEAGTSTQFPTLSLIHSQSSNVLTIQPFRLEAFPDMDILLDIPDDVLLHYTSTSPMYEEDDFCYCVRQALYYLRDNACDTVFGQSDNHKALSFERSRCSPNSWRPVGAKSS